MAAVGHKILVMAVSSALAGRMSHTLTEEGRGLGDGSTFQFPDPGTETKTILPLDSGSHFLRCKAGGASVDNHVKRHE